MKTSILMIIGGVSVAMWGIYRECPTKVSGKFLQMNGPIFCIALLMIVFTGYIGGRPLVGNGFKSSLFGASMFIPTLVIIPLVMGFGNTIGNHYNEAIKSAIMSSWGWALCVPAGFASATSNTFIGIIDSLWKDPMTRPRMLYLLTVIPMISLPIGFMRMTGMTDDLMITYVWRSNFLSAVWLMIPFLAWEKWERFSGAAKMAVKSIT